jgi:hypothetical protein
MTFDMILAGLFSPKYKLRSSDKAVWVEAIINGKLSKFVHSSL